MIVPVIKYKERLRKIMKKPVFTPKDLHSEGIPQNYTKKLLSTLAGSGRITRIERGKYTCLDDPIAVAGYITEPSYLTLWTAMNIRALTTQVPFSVEVATSRRRFTEKITFRETPIIFYTIPARMVYGYEYVVWNEKIRVPVATSEKIVIDSLHFRKIPGEELLNIMEHINCSLLKDYAALSENEEIVTKTKELMAKCSPETK